MTSQYQTRSRSFGTDITNLSEITLKHVKSKGKQPINFAFKKILTAMPEMAPYEEQLSSNPNDRERESFIKDNYMIWHSQISVEMRGVLVGWLMALHSRLGLQQQTLYLAVSIIDQYCSKSFIAKEYYQLLGLTSLFVAAKYEEIKTPRLKHYAQMVKQEYSSQQILEMEGLILLALSFNIKMKTKIQSLEEYLPCSALDCKGQKLTQYLLHLSLIQYSCCMLKPSVASWAVIIVACGFRGASSAQELEMAQSLGIGKSELGEAVELMERLFWKRQLPQFQEVNRAYLWEFSELLC